MSKPSIGKSIAEALAEFIGSALRLIVIGLVLAFFIQWAWNALVPSMAGWPVMNYGEACLLYFICSALFKTAWGFFND